MAALSRCDRYALQDFPLPYAPLCLGGSHKNTAHLLRGQGRATAPLTPSCDSRDKVEKVFSKCSEVIGIRARVPMVPSPASGDFPFRFASAVHDVGDATGSPTLSWRAMTAEAPLPPHLSMSITAPSQASEPVEAQSRDPRYPACPRLRAKLRPRSTRRPAIMPALSGGDATPPADAARSPGPSLKTCSASFRTPWSIDEAQPSQPSEDLHAPLPNQHAAPSDRRGSEDSAEHVALRQRR